MSKDAHNARCRCGTVEMSATGIPIVATVCHCDGCRQAGRILEKLPDAAPILDAGNGIPFVLFRKDRVRCTRGEKQLREHRLKESSPTRRVVAICCNTFMFLDFTKGHWITIAQDRMTDSQAVSDAPKQHRRSALFVLRLMGTWAKMGFRTPAIDYVHGELNDA